MSDVAWLPVLRNVFKSNFRYHAGDMLFHNIKIVLFFLAPLTSDLDLKPSLLSDGDSGSYGPLTASSKQYMSVLRKNYFV